MVGGSRIGFLFHLTPLLKGERIQTQAVLPIEYLPL